MLTTCLASSSTQQRGPQYGCHMKIQYCLPRPVHLPWDPSVQLAGCLEGQLCGQAGLCLSGSANLVRRPVGVRKPVSLPMWRVGGPAAAEMLCVCPSVCVFSKRPIWLVQLAMGYLQWHCSALWVRLLAECPLAQPRTGPLVV